MMHGIIPSGFPRNLGTKCFPLLLMITCGLLMARDADGNPAPASASDGLTAVDVHDGRRSCPLGQPPGWLADAVTKVQPEYPELAGMHKETGTGVFRMTVDATT